MNASGAMVTDTWIGDNYVDGSGAWVQGKTRAQAYWVQNNGAAGCMCRKTVLMQRAPGKRSMEKNIISVLTVIW